MSEIQNIIEALGQTLTSGDLNQLGKGLAGYVANGTFYTDSGIADAYVLTKIGTKQTAPSLTDGFELNFLAGNNGTGAATVNPAGLGVKNIKLRNGNNPIANDVSGRVQLIFDLSNDWFELINPSITNQSITKSTIAAVKADSSLLELEGARVFWMGYFSESDGGSNWGIVRKGAHVEDNGRIFSLDANTFIEANLKGVINIRKWGCDDSLANNSIQWQKAQLYTESNATPGTGGGTRVPKGIFTCLSPIDIGQDGFVEGIGYRSRPTWVGVNAFNFEDSGIPSGRGVFKDFWIIGDKTAGTIGLNVAVDDSGATKRIEGLTFKNITVDGFEEGFRLTGVRTTSIRKCTTINCWHGANLIGKNVLIWFNNCDFVRGATTLGSNVATGIRQYTEAGLGTEDLQIKDTRLFGFDYGIDITSCLVFHMEGCDLDFCVKRGARIVNVSGGGSIKSSWIFVTDDVTDSVGIDLVDLGADNNNKFVIFDNNIQRESAGTLVGMTGIFVGSNHRQVEIDKNTILKWHTSAKITSEKCKYTNNADFTTNSASVSLTDAAVSTTIYGNDLDSLISRTAAKPKIISGQNDGVLTEEAFAVVLGTGLTTQIYTWASLGLPDGMANGSFVVNVNSQGGTSSGWTRGAATATQLTVFVQTALGSPVGLDIYVKAF